MVEPIIDVDFTDESSNVVTSNTSVPPHNINDTTTPEQKLNMIVNSELNLTIEVLNRTLATSMQRIIENVESYYKETIARDYIKK